MQLAKSQGAIEVPRPEGSLFRVSDSFGRDIVAWLLFVVIVPQLVDLFPTSARVVQFTSRIDPTHVVEFILPIGLTLMGLTASTLIIVWQLNMQKYSGSFLRFVMRQAPILDMWILNALNVGNMFTLWVLTYHGVNGPNPAALRYVSSLTVGVLAFAAGIVWAVVSLIISSGHLIPRNLLVKLTKELCAQWGKLNSLANTHPADRKELNDVVEYTETLTENIGRVGLSALREGEFELLRETAKSLSNCYREGMSTIQIVNLRSAIFESGLSDRRDLKDSYWPTGLILRQLRDLHAYTITFRDPGFSDAQFLKLLEVWKGLTEGVTTLQIRHWVKLIEEVFVAALGAKRPIACFEMVEMALRLYEDMWAQFNQEQDPVPCYFSLQELTRLLSRLLSYTISSDEATVLTYVADALVRVNEINRSPDPRGRRPALALTLSISPRDSVYAGLVEAGIQAVYERRVQSVGAILSRIVVYLNPDTVNRLFLHIEEWVPPPPLNRSSVPAIVEDTDFFKHERRKFYALWLAAVTAAVPVAKSAADFILREAVFPSWFIESRGQLDALKADIFQHSPRWAEVLSGRATESLCIVFSIAEWRAAQIGEGSLL